MIREWGLGNSAWGERVCYGVLDGYTSQLNALVPRGFLRRPGTVVPDGVQYIEITLSLAYYCLRLLVQLKCASILILATIQ